MSEHVDCVVVGAGVIGLGAARALARAGREVIVLESEADIGTVTSARNSEVIHAGIYYTPGGLKARLCVQGRDALYRYAAERGVDHKRIGKLIVAVDEDDLATLDGIAANAAANSVNDLRKVDKAELHAMEPEIAGIGALHSPSTGIIDSHGLMLAYQGEAEDLGAVVALNSPLAAARAEDKGFSLNIGGGDPYELRCNLLVNAAGLGAQAVAKSIDGLDAEHVPERHLNKGCYFTMSGKPPFSRLIYPVPTPNSLGLHLTVDLGGQVKFGPDQAWIEEINYDVDPARAEQFYDAVRRYYPGLKDGTLEPAYSGIRPKVQAPGEAPADFVLSGPADHGVPGLVNMFGMESPGLTSSLVIGEYAVELLGV